MKKIIFLLIGIVLIVSILYYKKDTPLNSNVIVLGQSCALSGPAKSLGINMNLGALAYFRYINDNGGVHGRKISLIKYDDKYEPHYAIDNVNRLIKKDKVFALFGEVGTPTSIAVTPISRKNKVPFLTPFTGAEFLRSPFEKTYINLRASYYMETDALVEYLTSKNINKISILYQNDGYGKAGYKGVLKALKKRGLKLNSEGRYRRNTLSYFNAFKILKASSPEAIIIIGAYKQSSEFTKYSKNNGMKNVVFCNISFVGSKALIDELGDETDNVIISQVVPLPWNSSQPSVKEYQKIFSKYYPDKSYGFVSLEGFLSAKLVVNALELAGKNLTRNNFIEAFEKLPPDTLDGFKINMDKKEHQALDNVYITKYENNRFVQIKEIKNEQ
jgi:ABC-type branched-subunit amino acid transport system substrate-binding protein